MWKYQGWGEVSGKERDSDTNVILIMQDKASEIKGGEKQGNAERVKKKES